MYKRQVKDTIHTTELDTAYLRGRQLLEKRKYAQALYVLHGYRDRNTAIALLSLGQDREALRILEAIPATAISEYLRAIACARLGRKAEGRRHFLEACRRDERMEYRAALDPPDFLNCHLYQLAAPLTLASIQQLLYLSI